MSFLKTSTRSLPINTARYVLRPQNSASYSMRFPTLAEEKEPSVDKTTETYVQAPTELPPQIKLSAKERAKFSSMSIRDIFDGFLTTEESYDPIDTKPIFADPSKFPTLSTFHRDQVIQELEKRMKRNWSMMTDDQKRLAYFISYGNWGPRESLSSDSTKYGNFPPEDLPFELPSNLTTSSPSSVTKIHKLPDVDLFQISPGRQEEFRHMTRKFDPLSKTVIYFALIISALALWRDKIYGEEDLEKLKYDVPDSPLVIAEIKRQQEYEERIERERVAKEQRDLLEQEKKEKVVKRWYYLWLK